MFTSPRIRESCEENLARKLFHLLDSLPQCPLVFDGPLQGDWLAQCVMNWLGDSGTLQNFQYSNRRATHLGDTLVSGGHIVAIDIAERLVSVELFVKNANGDVTSPGSANVRLHS